MRITNEEKKIWVLCAECEQKTFQVYESKHRKFCSKECYHKSLKEHGKTLYFIYGRKALIHLQNLRDEAYNLGMRKKKVGTQLQYWWKTTKQELKDFINNVKRAIERKIENTIIDYEFGPRPAFIEENLDIPPPKNKDLLLSICCRKKIIQWEGSYYCEWCGNKII